MAQITIVTTPDQDAAAQVMFTRSFNPGGLTLLLWAKAQLVAVLDNWVAQTETERRISRLDAYKIATPADQAAVNTILDKYR